MFKTCAEEAEERGIEKGFKQGQLQGQRRLLLIQLEARFPLLSDAVRQRVAQLPEDKILPVALALLDGHSLLELGLED